MNIAFRAVLLDGSACQAGSFWVAQRVQLLRPGATVTLPVAVADGGLCAI